MIFGTETKQTVTFGVRKIRNKTSHNSNQTNRCPPKKGKLRNPTVCFRPENPRSTYRYLKLQRHNFSYTSSDVPSIKCTLKSFTSSTCTITEFTSDHSKRRRKSVYTRAEVVAAQGGCTHIGKSRNSWAEDRLVQFGAWLG